MKHHRLLLVRLGGRGLHSAALTPPLGILSLAAYVRAHFSNITISVYDQRLANTSFDQIAQEALRGNADIIGLSVLTPSAHMLPALTAALRAALHNALLVLGGPHVTAFGPRAMKGNVADLAVPGEGERFLEAIIERAGDAKFDDIPGLIRRLPGGEVVTNPGETALIDDVDSLPFPAYDLIDMRPYWRLLSHAQVPPRRYMAIHSSRGCPFKCIYCHRVFGKRVRAQSPERIAAEIEHYIRTYKIQEIEFLDDTFNFKPDHVTTFADIIRRRSLDVRLSFPNGLRGDLITPETADALVAAGTYYTSLALESGSPRIQELIGKRLNIPRFLDGINLLSARGVFTNGFTMLGFPTETLEEMRQTIETACSSPLHTATFFTVTPYPNTELFDWAMKTHPERLARLDYTNMHYTNVRVNLSEVPDHVLYATQRQAWRRFYFNPVRAARIIHAYPRPLFLMRFIPMFVLRLARGLIHAGGEVEKT